MGWRHLWGPGEGPGGVEWAHAVVPHRVPSRLHGDQEGGPPFLGVSVLWAPGSLGFLAGLTAGRHCRAPGAAGPCRGRHAGRAGCFGSTSGSTPGSRACGSLHVVHAARWPGRHEEVLVLDGVDGVRGKRVGVGLAGRGKLTRAGLLVGHLGHTGLLAGGLEHFLPPSLDLSWGHPGHVSLRPQGPEQPETPLELASAQCLATPSSPRRGSPRSFPGASATGRRVCGVPGALVLSWVRL